MPIMEQHVLGGVFAPPSVIAGITTSHDFDHMNRLYLYWWLVGRRKEQPEWLLIWFSGRCYRNWCPILGWTKHSEGMASVAWDWNIHRITRILLGRKRPVFNPGFKMAMYLNSLFTWFGKWEAPYFNWCDNREGIIIILWHSRI